MKEGPLLNKIPFRFKELRSTNFSSAFSTFEGIRLKRFITKLSVIYKIEDFYRKHDMCTLKYFSKLSNLDTLNAKNFKNFRLKNEMIEF